MADVKPANGPDIDKTISAMKDSVNLINKLIADNVKTEQTKNTVERNFRHLDLMMKKDFVKDSGKDLKEFVDAVTAGKAFIA